MAILQFSDVTTKKGIVQQIQKRTKSSTSGANSYSLNEICVDVNFALAYYFNIANQRAGRWNPADDTNQVDYPQGYFNINAGQQDVVFNLDGSGNQIRDIYKIRIKTTVGGQFITLNNLDLLQDDDDYLNNTTTGIPTGFRLTANGIIFDIIPNFTVANGGELFFSRTPTYFLPTDTTKYAGIPDEHQPYLVIKPSYEFCAMNSMPQTALLREILYGLDGKSGLEGQIKAFYGLRNRTERKSLRARPQNNR